MSNKLSEQAKKALQEKMENALKKCDIWQDSKDGSYELCLTVNGYYKNKKLIEDSEKSQGG
jgi:hypothetical protein